MPTGSSSALGSARTSAFPRRCAIRLPAWAVRFDWLASKSKSKLPSLTARLKRYCPPRCVVPCCVVSSLFFRGSRGIVCSHCAEFVSGASGSRRPWTTKHVSALNLSRVCDLAARPSSEGLCCFVCCFLFPTITAAGGKEQRGVNSHYNHRATTRLGHEISSAQRWLDFDGEVQFSGQWAASARQHG